ncbi:Holliday junction resolvase RuvX [Marinicellulosiphila megalodicopiae]|uniref:Holliday junction resolvase RuvX n=1 Tax=Marinicellulosiphila megalodicopiae TaxID=2724896 RepID=UPI003BAE9D0B
MSSTEKTVLSFDFGTTRFGAAIGQTLTGGATELPTFKAIEGIPNWEDIDKIIQEWQPDILLVGIPVHMDGTMSDTGLRARKFKNRLKERYKLDTQSVDERLTSFEAKGIALKKGKSNFKQHSVDSLAAVLIFETWFNQL